MIAVPLSVGRSYAVITASTNVVVNTLSGQAETETPEEDEAPEEDQTPEEETPEEDTGEKDTAGPDTGQTDETGTDSGAGQSTGSTKTGDSNWIYLWAFIAAAAAAGMVLIGRKLRQDRKERKPGDH